MLKQMQAVRHQINTLNSFDTLFIAKCICAL